MRPKPVKHNPQRELFRIELVTLVDEGHALVKLAGRMNWAMFEEQLGQTFCQDNGAPGISTRLMVGLHYLKYQYNLSDDQVLARWVENPYWQYFCGMQYFEHELPINPSSMTRWRTRLGEAGAETMLKVTIRAGLEIGAIQPKQARHVNVDTTVQTRAIRYPTDARLYDRARQRLVQGARKEGLDIKQSYERVGRQLLMKSSRYAHARQMKRAKACTRKLRTNLGRVIREVGRQQPSEKLQRLLSIAMRIYQQKANDKDKVYSVHEPETMCIAKGKAGKKYEFGQKVSVAVTSKGGWILGTQCVSGNPYDGHTLTGQMEQLHRLYHDKKIIKNEGSQTVHVDMGYRGHGYTGPETVVVDKRRRGETAKRLWKWMKRRAAVEPTIGHLKQEHRLERNQLRGLIGDRINALLSAAAMNFGKLMGFLLALFRYLLSRLLPESVRLCAA